MKMRQLTWRSGPVTVPAWPLRWGASNRTRAPHAAAQKRGAGVRRADRGQYTDPFPEFFEVAVLRGGIECERRHLRVKFENRAHVQNRPIARPSLRTSIFNSSLSVPASMKIN